MGETGKVLSRCSACDGWDIRTGDPEIGKLAMGKTVQLRAGFAVATPVVVGANDIHLGSLIAFLNRLKLGAVRVRRFDEWKIGGALRCRYGQERIAALQLVQRSINEANALTQLAFPLSTRVARGA